MSRLGEILKLHKFGCALNILNVRTFSGSANCREYDVVVVGGGIVGTATARELNIRHPNLKMAILEKENGLAKHQSGHNSGVIHAGIYYKPGSLKAKLCVEGLNLAYEYLECKGIPYKKVGKLIVATNAVEVERLAELYDRGVKNNVRDLQLLKGTDQIQQYEPNCVGLEAILSPHTGIVDWGLVTQYYGRDFQNGGGDIIYNFEVNGFKDSKDSDFPVLIKDKFGKKVKSKYVLTCGGLQSDILAEMTGCPRDPRIVPFRGEYLLLDKCKTSMVNGNIYPVPDPRFPFLGVHFTPRMDGNVWLGPNAVLAFQREGYRWRDINIIELFDTLRFIGFIKLALKGIICGFQEFLRTVFIILRIMQLQKLIPCIDYQDVKRGPSGVYAYAVDLKGNILEDVHFDTINCNSPIGCRVLHCRNIPSPGATSALAIAKMMADKCEQEFNLCC